MRYINRKMDEAFLSNPRVYNDFSKEGYVQIYLVDTYTTYVKVKGKYSTLQTETGYVDIYEDANAVYIEETTKSGNGIGATIIQRKDLKTMRCENDFIEFTLRNKAVHKVFIL